MGIPFGMRYRTTLSGSAFKNVTCEACGVEYVYEMHRQATAQRTSVLFVDMEGAQRTATLAASVELAASLANDCDAVPCPACGQVQAHMAPKAAQEHTRWVVWLQRAFVALAGLAGAAWIYGRSVMRTSPWSSEGGVLGDVSRGVLFIGVAGAVLTLSLRAQMLKKFDPNRGDPGPRIERGRSRAMRRTDFERWAKKAARKDSE